MANASTKSTTMFFSQEIDEERLENAKKRQKEYQNCDKKILIDQIEDLTSTLSINKQLMSQVFAAQPSSNNDMIRTLQE